jgi:galactofuranose transport system substrate-binding protein
VKIPKGMLLAVIFAALTTLVACQSAAPSAQPVSTQPSVVQPAAKKTYKDLVVGFAQLGAESEWRTANTASIQDAAKDLGVTLKFSDAQQKQENQIKAIRAFIAQKVDVIGVPPVVESGWETVFQEANDAGIPIILVDRRAAVPEDMYATYLGSDFVEEGRKAALEVNKLFPSGGKIVELVGTVGSAPANDRAKGFREKINSNIQIIDSQSGDFTRAEGKDVMAAFLQKYGKDIQGVYSHNDDMALGAIQAIEEYGAKPGTDIKIISVDAVRGAFQAMIDGKLNGTIECNPLLGPQFYELALKVVNGEQVPKWVPSKEGVFLPDTAAQELPDRKY